MKKTVKFKDIKNTKGKSDWNHLKKSDVEIHDVDAPPISQAQLMEMQRVKPTKPSR